MCYGLQCTNGVPLRAGLDPNHLCGKNFECFSNSLKTRKIEINRQMGKYGTPKGGWEEKCAPPAIALIYAGQMLDKEWLISDRLCVMSTQ